jgi:hypothetical protein
MNDSRNTSGQAYALTVVTPIRDGHEAPLAAYLDRLPGGSDSPLARVPGTHFARWVVIGDVVFEQPGQTRDHLAHPRLLFTSNLDGPIEPYLRALAAGVGQTADEIWGHCAGYPGSADADAFAAYLRAHQIESALFFAAYGDRTVEQVKHDLATRRAVIDFALRGQGMAAAELQAAFREAFPA